MTASTTRRPPRPSVSVVVCAYTENRWDDLVAAIRSVVGQLHAPDQCLVVIDHNPVLLRRAAARFAGPQTRVLASDQPPGLSGARNTGVMHSVGQVIAFLDDDAVAAADWLDTCLAGFAEPAVAAVGAAAVPQWAAGDRPYWFPPEYDWVVGCSYRGLPRQRAVVRNVIGAAMAFRGDVFDTVGLFDGTVGRTGATPLGCEETELCIRLHRARPAAQILYVPDAVVRHRVPADRSTVRYFLQRCFGEGISKARMTRLVGPVDGLASERDYVRRTLPRAVGRELVRAAHGRPGALGAVTMIFAGVTAACLGYLREQARRPEPSINAPGVCSGVHPHPDPALSRRRSWHAAEPLADHRR
jgi:GT2 family glycosyltransferase